MSNRGWDAERVKVFKHAFTDYLRYLKISSKESNEGPQTLKLYSGQRYFLTQVFDGLENDIHIFVVLKARQLGLSTIVRALVLFWAMVNKGLNIALVYDTEPNKEDARLEMRAFIDGLVDTPYEIRMGKKEKDSRTHLVFPNGSRISWMVAGVKKTSSSGGLGRSRGIAVAGCTEISSWADIEGFRSFQRALAQKNPDRLFIYESTARGFNIFHELWEEAKADDLAQRAIFIGWWAKEDYTLEPGSALYERYSFAVTKEEQVQIDEVKRRYGFAVTLAQLAWYRHEFDPTSDSDAERAGEEVIKQELPWTEDEAFLRSGSLFFSSEKLTVSTKAALKLKTAGYRYFLGQDFLDTIVEQVPQIRHANLKVWEEPDPHGVYVIGADPAFGSSEESDRSCAQVLRCYADGLDQVAEFNSPEIDAHQFAWVLAHLGGAYAGATGTARLLLEINGPGEAVLAAFRELELLLKAGYLRDDAVEMGLRNVVGNVKHYLYRRGDSLAANPTAWHWKTTTANKVPLMERLRDVYHIGQLAVRSLDAIREMEKIARKGDTIKGEGTAKDDRVIALALGVKAWDDGEKRRLIGANRTRAMEEMRRNYTPADMNHQFQVSIISDMFARARRASLFRQGQRRRGGRWDWL